MMLTHAMVLVTPWTLGVYMVRDYLDLPIHPDTGQASSQLIHGPQKQYDAHGMLLCEGGQNDTGPCLNKRDHPETVQDDEAQVAKREQMVGIRAGLFASSFSIAQVLLQR
jgi:hypothetical protein